MSYPKNMVLRNRCVFEFFVRVTLDVTQEMFANVYGFWLGAKTENDERVIIKILAEAD